MTADKLLLLIGNHTRLDAVLKDKASGYFRLGERSAGWYAVSGATAKLYFAGGLPGAATIFCPLKMKLYRSDTVVMAGVAGIPV
jgi:hypothetical protein